MFINVDPKAASKTSNNLFSNSFYKRQRERFVLVSFYYDKNTLTKSNLGEERIWLTIPDHSPSLKSKQEFKVRT